jgi:hypothetical protein
MARTVLAWRFIVVCDDEMMNRATTKTQKKREKRNTVKMGNFVATHNKKKTSLSSLLVWHILLQNLIIASCGFSFNLHSINKR